MTVGDRICPCMVRPTLVVAETEPLAALSTRKLVLETAKFNVLTAHSREEAVELLQRGQGLVSATIVVADVKGAQDVIAAAKQAGPRQPVIYISPMAISAPGADHVVSTHDPEALVRLCRDLLGDPRQIDGSNDRKL